MMPLLLVKGTLQSLGDVFCGVSFGLLLSHIDTSFLLGVFCFLLFLEFKESA